MFMTMIVCHLLFVFDDKFFPVFMRGSLIIVVSIYSI